MNRIHLGGKMKTAKDLIRLLELAVTDETLNEVEARRLLLLARFALSDMVESAGDWDLEIGAWRASLQAVRLLP